MASAVPMLAGYAASTAIAKIGENQGWSPALTGLLSTVGGAGVGSIGAGAAAAMGAGSGATNAFNPATTGIMAGRATATPGLIARSMDPTGIISSAGTGDLFASATGDQWKKTWSNPDFITSLGTTLVDGLFADPQRKQPLGGGGGGGGGGSAPAYSGGGAGGQYQLIQSFPERGTSIQWQEVA